VLYLSKRRHLKTLLLMDAIAPGIVLAQAIGRWGNYFNQELFGRPTTLPWGLKIDLAHRPAGYTQYATFHPTFLYESLWCLGVFGVLLLVENRKELRPGQVFALYVALYCFGRTFFEWLRIDDASRIFGVRFNLLLSAALSVLGFVMFVLFGRRPLPVAEPTDSEIAEPSEQSAEQSADT